MQLLIYLFPHVWWNCTCITLDLLNSIMKLICHSFEMFENLHTKEICYYDPMDITNNYVYWAMALWFFCQNEEICFLKDLIGTCGLNMKTSLISLRLAYFSKGPWWTVPTYWQEFTIFFFYWCLVTWPL